MKPHEVRSWSLDWDLKNSDISDISKHKVLGATVFIYRIIDIHFTYSVTKGKSRDNFLFDKSISRNSGSYLA